NGTEACELYDERMGFIYWFISTYNWYWYPIHIGYLFSFYRYFIDRAWHSVCNVLLPGVIKEKFPQKVAIMTSLYTTGMATFATTASGVSIPFANELGLGWQLSLLFWILPAVIGGFIWLIIAMK